MYIGLLLWHRLGFPEFCKEHMPEGREAIPWSVMACIRIVARFCAPSSELQIAESWYDKTALDDLLGVPVDRVNDDRLYRSLDALLPHKDSLCRHLQNSYGELFGETFDFLFYDITSTYLKGRPSAIRRPKGVTAVTAVRTVRRYVSDWLRVGKDCPLPLKSTTATVRMSPLPKKWC